MTADQSGHGPSPGGSHIVELVALWILFGAHSSVGFGLQANYKLTLPWISLSTNQHSQQRVSLNANPNFITPLLSSVIATLIPVKTPAPLPKKKNHRHPCEKKKKNHSSPSSSARFSKIPATPPQQEHSLIRFTSTAMTKRNVVVSDSNSTILTSHTYPPNPTKLFAISRNKKLLKKLETGSGGRINGWVDSMKASSPTHLKSSILDQDPDSWIIDHPSALSMFEQIMSASNGKQIVMFLDYDGTLSPIVEDPDCAFMSDAMRAAVQQVAGYFPTAIVSGRCRDKVYSFVGLAELYYAGSHGMDIKGPSKNLRTSKTSSVRSLDKTDNQAMLFQPASEFLPMIDEVYEALVEKTKSTPGAKVENNKFCVSVHFRCVDEKRWNALAEQVRSVLKEYPKLRLTQGRKVLEIRPTIKWDKGKALEFLLDSLGFTNCNDVLPVYIGDDRTDEDAFKVLRKRGQGFGILVSKIPKATNASYSLQEPAEVMDFLHRLVQWKQHQSLQVCKKL